MFKIIIVFIICDLLDTYLLVRFLSKVKQIRYSQFPEMEEFELEEQAAYIREYLDKKGLSKAGTLSQDR